MFGGRRGQRSSPGGRRRGADLRIQVELTFEQAAFGTEISIQVPRHKRCEECTGSGARKGTRPGREPSLRRHAAFCDASSPA